MRFLIFLLKIKHGNVSVNSIVGLDCNDHGHRWTRNRLSDFATPKGLANVLVETAHH